MPEEIILTSMCMVWDRIERTVLMINRQHDNWKGYAPPGGHVDFPESVTECAIREVKEETGLTVWDLKYKGVIHFVDGVNKDRYLVFNYITDKFSGELCQPTHEGKPEWLSLDEINNYQLAPGMAERMDLFFRESATEMHIIWDNEGRRDVQLIGL